MLRDLLVSKCVGMILDAVRGERGRLTFVSSESQVNRQYFNRRKFRTLKLFRAIRVLYVLAMDQSREEFIQLGQKVFAEIWDMQEDYGFELLDEYRNNTDDTQLR